MNKPCEQFYVLFKDFYFKFSLRVLIERRVQKRFSERFAKNCLNVNTRNRKKTMSYIRGGLKITTLPVYVGRFMTVIPRRDAREKSAAFLRYITTAYLCARKKKYTRG